jgi:two-component system, LytTR family, sensor histidine kinase AlgZ
MSLLIHKRKIFFIHLSFWCVYFSFFLYQISFPMRNMERSFLELLWDATFHVGSMMFIAYLNYFYFFPRFLNHRKIGKYLLTFTPLFALWMIFFLNVKRYIADGYTYQLKFMYSERFAIQLVLGTLFIVIFIAMLKFVEDWFELEAQRKALETEKLTAELQFLKAQINPHFLFNTLNNLYYLAFTQSPNTTEVIAKLSQMMRYMIYDSNHNLVPLSKEIEYMENYISLEKLRLNNEIPINFEVKDYRPDIISDAKNTEGVLITPLILITFLENAFKHGVSNNAKDAWVNIKIELMDNTIFYTVENSLLAQKDEKRNEKSGIGLQNVQRRLDLSYPNRYDLKVDETNNRYTVNLKLQLSAIPHIKK